MVSQEVEIEKKYDVGEAAEVPPLTGVPGVARVGEPRTATLDAVYFDTGRHTLASRRMTLRRRTGDADAGWHLKLPAEAVPGASGAAAGAAPQQRRELHEPLGQPDVVPDRLLAHLLAYLRGDDVIPVVRLETQRTTYPLYAEDGMHLADLADDRVTAELLGVTGGPSEKQQWREWELELVHGSPGLFPGAETLLSGAGAVPAKYPSKLAKALAAGGQETPPAETRAGVPGKKASAAAVVTAYLGAQVGEILANDPRVRLEEPEAVHNMRSAARRARSALAAYKRLYAAVALRRLRDELKWLGQVLGKPRDAEVMLDRLRDHIDELEPGPAATAVKAQLEKDLGDTLDTAYRKLQGTLLSERYYRLLDDLEAFRDNPPARPKASDSGRRVGGKLVDKAAKRLRRAHMAAKNARRGDPHETALHQVRKDAKRLRHVAESVEPVHGKSAVKVAKAARKQQQVLGDFHDSVIARDLLAEFGAVPGLPEPVASAYITLHTRQVQLAADAEAKYLKARKKSKKRLKAGVQ